MKLASFVAEGRSTYGVVIDDDHVIDLGARVGQQHHDLRQLIASGELETVVGQQGGRAADYSFSDIQFLPPIPRPTHILSSGGNFPAHIKEMEDAGFRKGPRPQFPSFHIKTSGSLVGHRCPLVKPKASDQFDWENEFAAVIGVPCRHVSEQNARQYVLGYSCFHDGSMRDLQMSHSVSAGKNFHRSSSFGPWIATKDEVGDIEPLYVTTRHNGEVVQHEQVGTLVFPMDRLISYFSQIIHLQPGDVVTSGSAGGVGYFRQPQVFMKAGDTLEIEVERVGALKHDIIDET
jgi:2-keto-4-pentenoate hydratase/2-oxohepta-3-ene-1,7-dioic acid hydratase in catechol pathway